jgi:hypothetical protein
MLEVGVLSTLVFDPAPDFSRWDINVTGICQLRRSDGGTQQFPLEGCMQPGLGGQSLRAVEHPFSSCQCQLAISGLRSLQSLANHVEVGVIYRTSDKLIRGEENLIPGCDLVLQPHLTLLLRSIRVSSGIGTQFRRHAFIR